MDRIEIMSNNAPIVACLFVTMGMCLLIHCLAMRGTDKYIDTKRASSSHMPTFIFLNRQSMLKMKFLALTQQVSESHRKVCLT
jgi:hypothetical protein